MVPIALSLIFNPFQIGLRSSAQLAVLHSSPDQIILSYPSKAESNSNLFSKASKLVSRGGTALLWPNKQPLPPRRSVPLGRVSHMPFFEIPSLVVNGYVICDLHSLWSQSERDTVRILPK